MPISDIRHENKVDTVSLLPGICYAWKSENYGYFWDVWKPLSTGQAWYGKHLFTSHQCIADEVFTGILYFKYFAQKLWFDLFMD